MRPGKKKERQGETEETIKIDGFLSFTPGWMLMYFFLQAFFESHPIFSWLYGYV
jgi:hypothetical protein